MRLHGGIAKPLEAFETVFPCDKPGDDRQFVEPGVARQLADQRHLFGCVGLVGDRFEEGTFGAPVAAIARNRAQGAGQRVSFECRPLRRVGRWQGGELRHRAPEFAQRELAIIPIGIFGSHLPITLRFGAVARTRRRATGQ